MTEPSPMPMTTRADAAALAPEQVGSVGAGRRASAAGGAVDATGRVTVQGKHVGDVSRSPRGLAWRARTPTGKVIGSHVSRQEAVGALVQRHRGA